MTDQQARQGQLERLVQKERLVRQGSRVLRDRPGLMESQVAMEPLELRVVQVLPDPLGQLDLMGQLEPLAPLARQELTVLQVLPGQPEPQGQREPQGMTAPLVRRDLQV